MKKLKKYTDIWALYAINQNPIEITKDTEDTISGLI
jgi:hypothetical protein